MLPCRGRAYGDALCAFLAVLVVAKALSHFACAYPYAMGVTGMTIWAYGSGFSMIVFSGNRQKATFRPHISRDGSGKQALYVGFYAFGADSFPDIAGYCDTCGEWVHLPDSFRYAPLKAVNGCSSAVHGEPLQVSGGVV